MGGQRHGPAALPLGKRRGIHWRRGGMGLGAALGGSGKSRMHRDSNLRTVQAIANRYTSTDRAGEPFWERIPKLFINFEEIPSHARGNFEEQIKTGVFYNFY